MLVCKNFKLWVQFFFKNPDVICDQFQLQFQTVPSIEQKVTIQRDCKKYLTDAAKRSATKFEDT